ncbi:MAG: di-heme oxidoredictase family protein [Chitinophagales bacterium]
MISVITENIKTIIAIAAIGVFLFFIGIGSCQKDGFFSASPNYISEPGEELSGGATTVFDQSVNAFALPAPQLSSADELLFFVGNSFFNQNWVQSPSSTTSRDGLGPYFNTRSCSGCHFKDGRGQPQATIGEMSQGFIVRLSATGIGQHGEPLADLNYGTQFHDHAIEGVKTEGKFELIYEEISGYYPDGTTFSLRKPKINFTELNYGPLGDGVMHSARVAPQMIGLGLLEAIPEQTILNFADESDANDDGISGKPNYVWNTIEQKTEMGRFGWKANQPTILQQIAAAFNGDMGITTKYFKEQNIESSQIEYKNLPNGGEPEIEDDDLEKMLLYSSTLAVPARRDIDDKNVLEGKKIFKEIGCNGCHIEKIQTGTHPQFSVLSDQTIRPFTDLLLHDMGDGLADGRPDFLASGSEWRTPPLWGIGLFQTVNKHTFYLHDGRARNLEEAILWHGGESENSKKEFMQLSKPEREKLLSFLESL